MKGRRRRHRRMGRMACVARRGSGPGRRRYSSMSTASGSGRSRLTTARIQLVMTSTWRRSRCTSECSDGRRLTLHVPLSGSRQPHDPVTPEKSAPVSKRHFDGLIRSWRRKLHKYDPPGTGEGKDVFDVSYAFRSAFVLCRSQLTAGDVVGLMMTAPPTRTRRSQRTTAPSPTTFMPSDELFTYFCSAAFYLPFARMF